MDRISLKNTAYFDFGRYTRYTRIKNYLKDYSQLYWSGSALSDRSLRVENNKNRLLGFSKGRPRPLYRCDRFIEVNITVIKGKKFRALTTNRLIQGDRLIRCLIQIRPIQTASSKYDTTRKNTQRYYTQQNV